MATFTYSYTFADTANGDVAAAVLVDEINGAETVSYGCQRIDVDDEAETFDVVMKGDLAAAGEQTALDTIVGVHAGVDVIVPVTSVLTHSTTGDNRLEVAITKSDTNTANFYSYNWCDPTTWYGNAIRVVNEVASNSGDNKTYNLANPNVIDIYHGKITQEDLRVDKSINSFRVTVKVDSIEQTEEDPHIAHMISLGLQTKYGLDLGTTFHGDYKVDYASGDIIFHEALAGTETVEVTYHYATNSVFLISANAGKELKLDKVDVQFSSDVEIRDTAIFYVYGYVDVFAPSALGVLTNPDTGVAYVSGDKFPLKKTTYKTIIDFHNDAFKSYPEYGPIGGSSWRGATTSTRILNWDYLGEILLDGDAGMEVRIYLEHDEPFGGSYATATLYCTVRDIVS